MILRTLFLQCKIQWTMSMNRLKKVKAECKNIKRLIKIVDLRTYCINHREEFEQVRQWHNVDNDINEMVDEINNIMERDNANEQS